MHLKKLIDEYLNSPGVIEKNNWIRHTTSQPSLLQRLEVATKSRDAFNNLNSHQERVGDENLKAFFSYMSKQENLDSIEEIITNENFDKLYRFLLNATDTYRIGELAAYDIALRLAHAYKFRPMYIYLHAGTEAGARALGILGAVALNGRDYITKEEQVNINREFEVLECDDIESFLCIYHQKDKPTLEQISREFRERQLKMNKYSKDKPYGQSSID
jgi:hypothetical protein